MARQFMQSMVFVSWLAGGDWDLDVRLEGYGCLVSGEYWEEWLAGLAAVCVA
jgi:hypothetical protein